MLISAVAIKNAKEHSICHVPCNKIAVFSSRAGFSRFVMHIIKLKSQSNVMSQPTCVPFASNKWANIYNITSIQPVCCKNNSWFHKSCVQKYADAAGHFHLKCPLCNESEIFRKNIARRGVFIPHRYYYYYCLTFKIVMFSFFFRSQ